MKTFRLIGMAFMAVCLSVNLTACSSGDDDEPNENGGTSNTTKKLIKIIEVDGNETTTLNFTYDKNGQLSSSIGYYNETLSWNDNTIIAIDYDNDGYTSTFNLSNGLIVNYVNDNDELKYDSSNRIILLDDDTFTWEGKRITKIQEGDHIIEYKYTGIKHKGWAPTFGSDSSLWGTFEQEISTSLYYAHPELFGIKDCELPSKRKVNWSNGDVETTIISYTFYDDGYVKTRAEIDEDGYATTYTYTWE